MSDGSVKPALAFDVLNDVRDAIAGEVLFLENTPQEDIELKSIVDFLQQQLRLLEVVCGPPVEKRSYDFSKMTEEQRKVMLAIMAGDRDLL
jgi:hypothetical protein